MAVVALTAQSRGKWRHRDPRTQSSRRAALRTLQREDRLHAKWLSSKLMCRTGHRRLNLRCHRGQPSTLRLLLAAPPQREEFTCMLFPRSWSERETLDKIVQGHIIIRRLGCNLPSNPEWTLSVRLTFTAFCAHSHGLNYILSNS